MNADAIEAADGDTPDIQIESDRRKPVSTSSGAAAVTARRVSSLD